MSEPSTPVYDQVAERWVKLRRQDLVEEPWLRRFADVLSDRARVLDLGCGTGRPIGEWLLGAGFDLVGLDASPAMITEARVACPEAAWHVADMRALPDLGRFDGLISWDGLFHLSVEDQRALLPRLASIVDQGGAMLFTIGPSEGQVCGAIAGLPVEHASLSPAEYELLLRRSGFGVVEIAIEDAECAGHSIVLATGKHGVSAETPVG